MFQRYYTIIKERGREVSNMTLENFERIKRGLDELGIYYIDGNYYKDTAEGETICGHWLEIKGALIETSEISKENN